MNTELTKTINFSLSFSTIFIALSSGYIGNDDNIGIGYHDYIWVNYIMRNNSLVVFSNAIVELENYCYSPKYLGYLVLGL